MREKTGCVRSRVVVCLVGDQSMDASSESRRRLGDRIAQNSSLLAKGFDQQVRDERLVQTEMMRRASIDEMPEVR